MPRSGASGNVFKLSAEADLALEKDGGGLNQLIDLDGHAYVDNLLKVEAEAEICHGINLSLYHTFEHNLRLALAPLLFLVKAQGQATAEGGVRASVHFPLNLFEEAGFIGEVTAQIQASVMGRIEGGLELEELIELSKAEPEYGIKGLALAIFLEFLEEVNIAAGMWGRVNAGGGADAHIKLIGTLHNENESGFLFSHGASASFGLGSGYEVSGGIGLNNPRRFYNSAVRLIAAEVVHQGRQYVAPHRYQELRALGFVLPIALRSAYCLGHTIAEQLDQNSEKLVNSLNEVILEELQHLVLNLLFESGERLLTTAIERIMNDALEGILDDQQSEALVPVIEQLIGITKGDIGLDDVVNMIISFSALAAIYVPTDQGQPWNRPLAILWSALAVLDTLNEVVAKASVSASIVGIGHRDPHAELLKLPADPPELVCEEYKSVLDIEDEIDFTHAVEYLILSIVEPLEELIPDGAALLDELASHLSEPHLNVTVHDIIELVLHASLMEDISETKLYEDLSNFVKETVQHHVIDTALLNKITAHASRNADICIYSEEVVRPALYALTDFTFRHIDELVAGRVISFSSFKSTVLHGVSALIYKILGRNVVVVADIIVSYALTNMGEGFKKLSVEIDEENVQQQDLVGMVTDNMPGILSDERRTEIVLLLAKELTLLGAEMFGSNVWTEDRRHEMRRCLFEFLDINFEESGSSTIADPEWWTDFADQLYDCAIAPSTLAARDLAELMIAIMADEITIVTEGIASIGRRISKDVGSEYTDVLESAGLILLQGFKTGIQEIKDILLEIDRTIHEIEQRIRDYTAEKIRQFKLLADLLANQSTRDAIIAAVRAEGLAVIQDNAVASVVDVLSEFLLPDVVRSRIDRIRDKIRSRARESYVHAFDTFFAPIFDGYLSALGELYEFLVDAIERLNHAEEVVSSLEQEIQRMLRPSISDLIGNLSIILNLTDIGENIDIEGLESLNIEPPDVTLMSSIAAKAAIEKTGIDDTIEHAVKARNNIVRQMENLASVAAERSKAAQDLEAAEAELIYHMGDDCLVRWVVQDAQNDHRINRYRHGQWEKLPERYRALDIAAGSDDSVYVLGVGSGEVFKWNGEGFSHKLDGLKGGARITVDGQGDPWVVQDAQNNHRINRYRHGQWEKLPERYRALDIAAGSDDSVYVLGVGSGEVFKWESEGFTHKLDGLDGSVRITVDSQGNPWVVQDAQNNHRINRHRHGQWEKLSERYRALDIAAGSDDSVYVLGVGAGEVFKWDGKGFSEKLDGLKGGAHISVENRVKILAPSPLDAQVKLVMHEEEIETFWLYGKHLPLHVRIYGGNLTYIKNGSSNVESTARVAVRINGRTIDIPEELWECKEWRQGPSSNQTVLELSMNTSEAGGVHLVRGLNTLELCVATGTGSQTVESVAFIADPTTQPASVNMQIGSGISKEPTLEGHRSSDKVLLVANHGSRVDMTNWRLVSRTGYRYWFSDKFMLNANEIIRLHSKHGQDRRTVVDNRGEWDLFWGLGKRPPIPPLAPPDLWQTGDVAYLIDGNGILVAEQTIGT